MANFVKRNKKMYKIWVVISILAVLGMIAFTVAPLFRLY
jgi:hypothetical protein